MSAGMEAKFHICHNCAGISVINSTACQRCKKKFPKAVKSIPANDMAKKKVTPTREPQPQQQVPKELGPISIKEEPSESPSVPAPPLDKVSTPVQDAASETKKVKIHGFKVNKTVKRRRRNARLRKILQPKNALMVLNELKSGIKFTFQEHRDSLSQTVFVVDAEVDGKTYTGQGLSKTLAKQRAAENALKDLLLPKVADATIKAINEGGGSSAPVAQNVNMTNADTDSVDGRSEAGEDDANEDGVPWGSLASFAIFKLFKEWQSQKRKISYINGSHAS